MATDSEREVFASNVLTAVGEDAARLPSSKVSGFLAMAGWAYNRRLMVIGRAVNGWVDGIFPRDLATNADANHYAKLVQESVSGNGECPMRWVTYRSVSRRRSSG
jgi:hypothetical protein